MQHRWSLFVLIMLICLLSGSGLDAHTTAIATTGASAAGVPSATWGELSSIALNNSGAVAFTAKLQHGGSIASDNDSGVWLFGSTGGSLLAQTGTGNVPGIANANFSVFSNASLSDSGEIFIAGTLETGANGVTTSNNHGIWGFGAVDNSLLARTGSGNVPDVPNASFSEFNNVLGGAEMTIAGDGRFPLVGSLAIGAGGVLTSNNRGLWSFSSGGATLVARKGSLNVPGLQGASFNNFVQPAVNSNNQLAVFASLKTGGSVTSSNALGIWRYSGASGELLARSGVSNVPEVSGVDFSQFDLPRINDAGQVVIGASLSNSEQGIWLYTEVTGVLLAMTANGNVPDVSGANFEDFVNTAINNVGQVLVNAELEIGAGGVTSENGKGLWLLSGAESLIARTGSGDVPEVPAANFAGFQTNALNENGRVAFAADLQLGVGGVDSSNDSGIWIVDPLGESWLVAREGDQLAGRTIATLDFLGDDAGQSSGFNDLGELAFQATFTDGDNGLFLFRPYAADFDRDTDVDADDLAVWESAFAATSTADADKDGDTDGSDFLVWQREAGSGAVSAPITTLVPEPASWLLFLVGLLSMCQLAPHCRK